MAFNILILDDEEQVIKAIKRALIQCPYECDIDGYTSSTDAFAACKEKEYQLIISDMRMPFITGTEFLAKVVKVLPKSYRVLLSAYADFEEVVESFNHGVVDKFMAKPWSNAQLIELIKSLIDSPATDSIKPASKPTPKSESPNQFGLNNVSGLLAKSHQITQLGQEIQKMSLADMPIYLHGESGSGKELCAKAVHQLGPRSDKPFVAVNCANFSEQLLESQLFGHVKGAFTGATQDQAGILDSIQGGVLFLDEVVEIPIVLQAKLLRVLQEREYQPVGSQKVKQFDGNIVSASAKHIDLAVNDGSFKEDLKYRLCVLPIEIPPLRARDGDAVALFQYFVSHYSHQMQHADFNFDDNLLQFISQYSWPGNVRELINVAAYSVAMLEPNETLLKIKHLPTHMQVPSHSQPSHNVAKTQESHQTLVTNEEPQSNSIQTPTVQAPPSIKALDENQLIQLLHEYDNNQTALASYLGVSRMTLWRKMKSLGMTA